MRTIFYAALPLLFFLAACGDASTDQGLLNQPPYSKLTDSIRTSPRDAGLHYRRGVLLYQNDQPEAAGRDLRAAWQLDPQEGYALSMVTLLKQKSPDSAIAFIRQALQVLPSSLALQVGLARGYQQTRQPDKALAACNEILAHYPSQLDALLLKAEVLKDQEKDAEALTVLEQAYRYAPGDADLAHTLADAYAEAGNPKALRLSDSLIRADVRDQHPEPYYFKGVYYSNTSHPDSALRQFDAAIAHDIHFMNAYINKGIIYFDQKKYDQALRVFDLATTVSPQEATPYYWLAKTQEALGHRDEAQLNYRRSSELERIQKADGE